MGDFQLIIDPHKHAGRQGPGGDEEIRRALSLAMIDHSGR